MQEEDYKVNRRTFLRLSGTGITLAGTQMLLPKLIQAEESPLSSRTAPDKPIILRSSQLEMILDPKDGLPYEFRLGQARLRGEDTGRPINLRLCRREPWSFANIPVTASKVHAGEGTVDFSFSAAYNGVPAVSLVVRYAIRGAAVIITLEQVTERPGYELISISMPRLVTIREEDGIGWLAHGDAGGSLTMLHEATAGSLPPNRFWGDVLGTLPVVMVGTDRMMCVQETTAYMDGTSLTVTGGDGARRVSLGGSKAYRVDGSACYDLNGGKDIPLNCGTAQTPNLLVSQQSSSRLDFLPVAGKAEDAWLEGAKLVGERMPAIPNHFYDDKYVYGIRCDQPLFPKPAATFAECETKIQDVASLIDNWPQVVHLWGWQFRGKDTGYPAVNQVNQRLGGYDGMMQVMESGKRSNATVTISDNYDDAYRSSPAWSDNIIARRPDGELWKSRSWTGENSYIIGLAKYMAGPGPERVRYTCERYRLPQTTHIDVLSYYSIRNDWDPEHPASGIKNLVEGRYRVLQEFKAHGVDVSSEALRYPMIGHISCFWYAQGPGKCPFGGKQIPLLPLVYRKSAVWGLSGSHAEPGITRLYELFLGASPRAVGLSNTDPKAVMDLFYLWLLPWCELHMRNIESFTRDGDRTIIGLEGNSSIEIDWTTQAHTIKLDGNEVARTGQAACPMGKDRIAFYSTDPRVLRTTLPEEWNPADIAAVTIAPNRTPTQRGAAQFKLIDRTVEVSVTAQQPVILYRDKRNARL